VCECGNDAEWWGGRVEVEVSHALYVYALQVQESKGYLSIYIYIYIHCHIYGIKYLGMLNTPKGTCIQQHMLKVNKSTRGRKSR